MHVCRLQKEDTMNIIECTIKMKEGNRDHFQRLAEAMSVKEVKQLFTILAAAEDEHIGKLKELMNTLCPATMCTSNIAESVCVYSPHIDANKAEEELQSDPDAYGHVVAEEAETAEFFEQLAVEAEDEQMRKLCQELARSEHEHQARLENIYSFMEDPRTFLEWGEFSNLRAL